ncbi:MAG: glycoside hydrolase family 3 C-terminal domain-containing protein [Chloroflexi bacterium]|nr:glycoside hydrolase family 3 C-terminal domain-containing protein [Chloroflexota bacterium]
MVACQASPTPTLLAPTLTTLHISATPTSTVSIAQRVDDLLARMTLEEKIGQMTQVENGSIKPSDVTAKFIGSVLSGGDGAPQPNNQAAWTKMINDYQAAAVKTRLGIPLIYGVDAVHGFGGLNGATIFPHNIGLGATRDADLVRRIGRATAEEMTAVGIYWNFAPVVAVPQDVRWGRTYEAFSENTGLVAQLGAAYVHGLQDGSPKVAATPKHFIGDGGTTWGTSRTENYQLDQGDMQVDESVLRQLYLPPYKAAIDAGAKSVMVSFSSWNGVKMHAQKKLIAELLKGELGFNGFVVSDWAGINQITNNYDDAIVTSINAGLDMIMVPDKYGVFIDGLTRAVNTGRVPMSRIDDAVRRILTVKFELGLFDHPFAYSEMASTVGSDAHRQLAREAVRKSLVLLKNENNTLPLAKDSPLIYIAGQGADDLGMQSGGWTLAWQGTVGNRQPGTTILGGIQQVAPKAKISYNANGKFDEKIIADVGIVVVGEQPYAEGRGDSADLSLSKPDLALIDTMKARSKNLVVILLSGRPLTITDALPKADAFVAAWLPGTEGAGIADVLFGDYDFTGKLPYMWQRFNTQLPAHALSSRGCGPLFPFGFGLSTRDIAPPIPTCPSQP